MRGTKIVMQKIQSAVTNKFGHVASRCYLKDTKDTKVNQLSVKNESREKNSDIVIIAKERGT